MFPPSLPRYFIEQCTRPGDVVLDPFAGRGTAPLEALLAGRFAIGSDANPLAVLLTRAKLQPPTKEEALQRLHDLSKSYVKPESLSLVPPEIKLLFDGRRTLPQLVHLRRELDTARDADRFLLACLAGILHGNHARDPRKSRTLSISMPNTFSMAPGYIQRYKRSHKLRKYPFDVFKALERRLDHLFRNPEPLLRGRAFQADARQISHYVRHDSVDLVVTSPPYLHVVRYGKYNWIRLWLLKRTVEDVDRRVKVERTDRRLNLSDRLDTSRYHDFMAAVLAECSATLRPGGTCVLVIGDVRDAENGKTNLALDVWRNIRRRIPLRLLDSFRDSIDISRKVTRIWGATKGDATRVDRILVLRKPGGIAVRPRRPQTLTTMLSQT